MGLVGPMRLMEERLFTYVTFTYRLNEAGDVVAGGFDVNFETVLAHGL
jgi:hypothetical protein